jgi:hypothetical protein
MAEVNEVNVYCHSCLRKSNSFSHLIITYLTDLTLRRIWGSRSSGYDEFCTLGYNAMWSVKSQLMFWGMWCLYLKGWRISQAWNQNEAGSKQSPEYWGIMFLGNVSWLSTDYMVLYPRRQNSSEFTLCFTYFCSWFSCNNTRVLNK